MILFLKLFLALEIVKLDFDVKNYFYCTYSSTSILSYAFMMKITNNDFPIEKRNYKFEVKNSYKFFDSNISNDTNILDVRFLLVEAYKSFSIRSLFLKIHTHCTLVDIFPQFEFKYFDQDFSRIKAIRKKNVSKIIWFNFFLKYFENDRHTLILDCKKILKKSLTELTFMFNNKPLLYLNKNLKSTFSILSVLIDILKNKGSLNYYDFSKSLNYFIENYPINDVTDRYFLIKGFEIDYKFKDFVLSCLFTDLVNVIGFYRDKNQYCFKIHNFLDCNSTLNGVLYFCIIINLHDYFNSEDKLYLYGKTNKFKIEMKHYVKRIFQKNLYIFIEKFYCKKNNIKEILIIIESKNKFYESDLVKLENIL